MVDEKQALLPGLGAVVLCGGSSSRMGIDKANLPFGDQTFLQCVLDRLRPIVSPIVLVTNPSQGIRQLNVSESGLVCVHDEDPGKGPTEGIRVGLKYLASHQIDLAFVTSCDVPLLNPRFVRFLYDRIESGDDAIVPMRNPRNASDQRRVYGISAIYRTTLHQQITELIEQDKLRVSDISDYVNSRKISLEEIMTIDRDLHSLMSINSGRQYLQMLAENGLECPAEVMKRLIV